MVDSGFHRDAVGLDVHVPHSFTYANAATRLAAISSNFTDPDDLRKHAYQESDDTLWLLTAITPSVVWKQIGANGGGGVAGTLAETLLLGNVTGGTDLVVSAGDDLLVQGQIVVNNDVSILWDDLGGGFRGLKLSPTGELIANAGDFVLTALDSVSTTPRLDMERDTLLSANSPIGAFRALSQDSANTLQNFGQLEFQMDDSTAGVEQGALRFFARDNGVLSEYFSLNKNATGIASFLKDVTIEQGSDLKVIGDVEQVSGEDGNTYTPTVVSTTAIGSNPRNSTVLGSNLYVVDQSGGDLRIYDVTDPAVPVLLGSVTGLGGCRGVDIAGRYVYVSAQSPNTLHIVDVQDKSTPVLLSSVALPSSGAQRGVRVRGTVAFTTNNGAAQAFTSVDVTDPNNPVVLDTLTHATGPRTEFDIANGVAFLNTASTTDNFFLVDVSDPANLSTIVSLDVGNTQWATKIQGPYAYVVGESAPSFQIFDVSDPAGTTNTPVGSLSLGTTSPRALDVVGAFAYVVDASGNQVQVINIADPTAPFLIGSATLGQNPVSISTVGRYGYVTDNTDDNFMVVDFGGIDAQNLNVGNADVGDLNVRRDVKAAGLVNAAGAIFGAEGVNSDGDVVAKGRVLGGVSKNVVEVFNEDDFPDVGGFIKPNPGATYLVMQPIAITKKIAHPTTVTGFDPAVIRTDAKYGNIITVNIASGSMLETSSGSGQLVLQNIRFESDGTVPFAIVSGASQTSLLTELDDCDIVGFASGSKFTECIFNLNNATFWTGSGSFDLVDCECNLINAFNANFTDLGDPVFRMRSSASATTKSFFTARNSKLSSQANESFFMIHPNLIAGSSVRTTDVEFSPFTPGTGEFYATESGSITALADSGGAPGVRTVVSSAGHTVADGDTFIQAGFTTETQMNGTFLASDIIDGVSYEIIAVFSGTDTGTWTNTSLDQSDPKVFNDSPGQEVAKAIGSAYVSGNIDETVIATQNVFVDLDLGTALAASNIEGWSLTDTTTGELTYDGIEPLSGTIIASVSAFSAGAAQEFDFRAVKNGSILPDAVETSISLDSSTGSAALVVPISVVNGDAVRLQVENADGTTNLTVSQVSISIQ